MKYINIIFKMKQSMTKQYIWALAIAGAFVAGTILASTMYDNTAFAIHQPNHNPPGDDDDMGWKEAVADLQMQVEDLEDQEFQISSVERNSETLTISPLGSGTATATCESDETVTGGGFVFNDLSNTETLVIASFSIESGWRIIVINDSVSDDLSIRATATCSKIVPVP